MKKIAVANQKGGVGKSTLAVHLVYAAREAGLRVLLVDMDRMGSFSTSFPESGEHQGAASTASELFLADSEIRPELIEPGFAIIRADEKLAALIASDQAVIKQPSRHLRNLSSEYDLCVIDTPGLLGMNPPTTIGALVAADAVVCPFGVGLYEAKAVNDLWTYLRNVKLNGYNPRLQLMGLIPSKVQTTSRADMKALAALREAFGEAILPHMLGERTSVKQAIAQRKPVWKGTRGAGHLKAAQEWRDATQYILTDLGVMQ